MWEVEGRMLIFKDVHLSLTYVSISVSKFWTQPSLKPSSVPVTAGWNGGARLAPLVALAGLVAWGDEGSVTASPSSLQPCPQVQGHPWTAGECWAVTLQALLRNLLGSEGLQSKVFIAPSASHPPSRPLLIDNLSSFWFCLIFYIKYNKTLEGGSRFITVFLNFLWVLRAFNHDLDMPSLLMKLSISFSK